MTGTPPGMVTVSARTTANKTQTVTYYYDGFGQLLQLQTATDTGGIVKNLYYDGNGRVVAEDNPSTTTTAGWNAPQAGTPQTNYTYDPLDRVTLVVNPDGTNKTTSFDRANITDYDENGHRHTYTTDALGRITTVLEYNNDPRLNITQETYTTNYTYDANDNLVQIVDSSGHVFGFSYDTLSHKVGMSDPDMGNWTYQYDARGNLITQTDARNQTITLSYDPLDRITSKTSADVNETFSYDAQYEGTLTNLTMNTMTSSFSYDDRLRLTSRTDTIDGTPFTTNYVYDSQDRVISEQGPGGKVDYLYNRQGGVRSIPGFINDAQYDAFGSLVNRTYANGLIATYAYNPQNHRLSSISVPGVQNQTFAYDSVGNIKSINDYVTGRNTTLSYDNLDRLVTATIGTDQYAYLYNPQGSLLSVTTNNLSKQFVYNGLAHAPSSIIDAGTSATVYHVNSLNTASRNRTVEFFLTNNQNTSGVNATVDFGNGMAYNANNLSINNSLLFLVQQNYTTGGNYLVNITAVSPNTYDYASVPIKLGVRATGLGILAANVSARNFEFDLASDIIEALPNVSWNCSGGNNGLIPTLTGNLSEYFTNNYTASGPQTVTCTAYGQDGNDLKTIAFTIPGLSLTPVDTLSTNVSQRVIAFTAANNYNPATPTLTITGEAAGFGTLVNLSTGQTLMVFAQFNNTLGNAKAINIGFSSGNDTQNTTTLYDVKGVSIDSYQRVDTTNLSRVYLYTVRNLWYNGTLSWTMSDPGIANATVLGNNQSLLVFIASNYSQGDKTPTLNATVSTASASITDHFVSKPLALTSLLTLVDGPGAVSELAIQNYAGTAQNVSWVFNTGQQNVTSTATVNGSLLVYVQSNYTSAGVYRTNASINSTTYADSKSGVVVQ